MIKLMSVASVKIIVCRCREKRKGTGERFFEFLLSLIFCHTQTERARGTLDVVKLTSQSDVIRCSGLNSKASLGV